MFQRLELIIGKDVLEKLQQSRVLVFGLGGVGSWCAEALVRSGIGKISIIDFDTITESNINRQIQATSLTVGQCKAAAMKQRLKEINPDCEVIAFNSMFARNTAGEFNIKNADYAIDAIDILDNKLDLIEICCNAGIGFYSSMGMARKLDPARIKTAGIWETHGCPLAKHVREGLRKRKFTGSFTAVYSDEIPVQQEKKVNGSIVTVTASAGMILASLVLRSIIGDK
jgi:tRNA A37 threonylcarbamoyladenosine dehydratase